MQRKMRILLVSLLCLSCLLYAIESFAEVTVISSTGNVKIVRAGSKVGYQCVPNMKLKTGDTLVLFGTPECLEHAEAYLLNG